MAADEAWDVIVVGAGNAALCAALSAAEQGAKVLVLEKATARGARRQLDCSPPAASASATTASRTCAQDILDDMTRRRIRLDRQPADAVRRDSSWKILMRVTENKADEDLAEHPDRPVARHDALDAHAQDPLHPDVRPAVVQDRRQAPFLRRREHRGGRRRLGPGRHAGQARRADGHRRSATRPACASCSQNQKRRGHRRARQGPGRL